MRVDHVQAAPVPELHVHVAQAVLVITGDDEPAALAGDRAGQVQRPLLADRLDHHVAEPSAGELTDLLDDPLVSIHWDRVGGAGLVSDLERERPPTERYGARAGVLDELREDRAEEPDADDRDRLPRADPAAVKDVDRTAERLGRERRAAQRIG